MLKGAAATLGLVTVIAALASPAVAKVKHHLAHAALLSGHPGSHVAVDRPADLGDRYPARMFESYSQGHQWFPNPDRLLPVPEHWW
jgi:hypothetical protein